MPAPAPSSSYMKAGCLAAVGGCFTVFSFAIVCGAGAGSGSLALSVESQSTVKPPSIVAVERLPQLERKFKSGAVWKGADGALSVPLSRNETLWLFGDTWIKQSDGAAGTRAVPENRAALKERSDEESFGKRIMLRNTGAVQQMEKAGDAAHLADRSSFKFLWRLSGAKPADLLAPQKRRDWYWPGVGIKYGDALYLVMKRIRKSDSGPPEFRFDWYKDDLVVIDNPFDPPMKWRVSINALPDGGNRLLMGVASLELDGYLYLYCSMPSKKKEFLPHPTGLARVLLSDLKQPGKARWQYYCDLNGGGWCDDAARMKVLFADGAPEMSVSGAPGGGVIAVYMPPLSEKIMLRRAERPEGPFSEPVTAYVCPEAGIDVLGQKTLVYTARAHPELTSGPCELIVTYCVNPGSLAAHVARPDLYYPGAIRITLRE